ncbi:MAG: 2-oxoacid:acceptor oxidoreductase family protein [Rhodobacteraceae bacterium]|nr:2-oxoacid:acceptor oxidoreductase family protein [Paracoccaceae bacterium]
MREILILGRGGQGAQTAGNLLAQAFFEKGQYVQTFATYGGARRGTPVMSSIRVDDRPIKVRSNIERADAMLCFDDSLLDQAFLKNADNKTLVVVNSTRPASDFAGLGDYRIVPVDGRRIARDNDMGKVINSTLLGAFVAVMGQPGIDAISDVIESNAPAKKAQNVAACREAFDKFSATAKEPSL